MKKTVVSALAGIFIFLTAGCGNIEMLSADSSHRRISAKEARAMMNGLTDYILLDVRTAEEFRQARIAGAILIPGNEIRNRAATELPDKNAVIIVYCRSGGRSVNASHELIHMGYKNVYDIIGGIIDWPYGTISGMAKK
jgi:rhodanese-related sulfurtransferase